MTKVTKISQKQSRILDIQLILTTFAKSKLYFAAIQLLFMRRVIGIFIAFTTLFAASCEMQQAEDIRIENASGNTLSKTTITISLNESRTQLGEKVDGVYRLFWSEGDKISANGIESSAAVINENNPARATFNFSEELAENCQIAYPAAPEGKVRFAENQVHVSNSTFGSGIATMYGTATSEGIELKHLTGVVKIGIIGSATLTKVHISTADGTPISGLFDLDFTNGTITPTAEANDKIYYSFGNGVKLDAATPTYIHIAIPAGEYSLLRVRLYDNEGGIMSKEIRASSAKPIRAGIVREFTNIVTYKADRASDVEIGKMLPLWEEGYLDIHMINSARGECSFLILPDGTTLVVDVGEITPTMGTNPISQLPSVDVRPTTTYARYIKNFLPADKSWIDYCHLSHFHNDHFGDPGIKGETNPVGYRRIGPMALYDHIPFKNTLDRAYPDYVEDSKTAPIDHTWLIEDWKTLIKWGEENGKIQGARFEVGQEQIKLLYNKEKYSNFYTMNICGNGYGYYIKSGATKPAKVGSKSDGGNPSSCGFYLRYGEFDYVSAGDVTSAPQNRMAYYFRDCADGHKLDAMKGGHHLSGNSYGGQMEIYMFPNVILNQNFYKSQPDIDLLNNKIFPTIGAEVYTINAHPDALTEYADTYAKISGYNGHIVLRVAPGGGSYYVYMLDATDFEYRVKSIHGPYTSR